MKFEDLPLELPRFEPDRAFALAPIREWAHSIMRSVQHEARRKNVSPRRFRFGPLAIGSPNVEGLHRALIGYGSEFVEEVLRYRLWGIIEGRESVDKQRLTNQHWIFIGKANGFEYARQDYERYEEKVAQAEEEKYKAEEVPTQDLEQRKAIEALKKNLKRKLTK